MSKISVLINNYNYGKYVGEAIASVLSQKHPDFELIVVDDGSTDQSLEVIDSFHDDRMKTITKLNGGQLSAFNAGFLASSGEIICFLDADDMYQPGYLSAVDELFSKHSDCGCLMGRIEYFGLQSGSDMIYPDGFFGCNPFSVATRHVWRGTSTSAISMRRSIAETILPCSDNETFWKTRADDLLVWGTDLVCANKYCFSNPSVKYRVHDNNYFFGKQTSPEDYRKRRAAAVQFCSWIMEKNHLKLTHLMEIENRNGNLKFSERMLSWLKAGKSRMLSFPEWIKCGVILLRGIFTCRHHNIEHVRSFP